MEEDIRVDDNTLSQSLGQRVEQRLESAIEAAQERIDYEAAHNPELLRSLDIVHRFLKRKGRVCYGGTAMNAILPPKKRFYDPETDLPDYDFFTPAMDEDIADLVKDLTAAGFKDVYHRVGIHEGTKKILVNFVPIADITSLSPEVYSVFHKRAVIKGGVRYTDPDVLRMMMYLEMSRPKGMVSRWEKVYERLELINETFPPKVGSIRGGRTRKGKREPAIKVKREVGESLLNFVIEHQRILFTGDLHKFYTGVIRKRDMKFDPSEHTGVVGFLSSAVREDAVAIQKMLGGPANAKSYLHKAKGEIIPEHLEIRYHGHPVAILFQEAACHAYLNFSTPDGRSIPIASLDTLITLYYGIALFTFRARTRIPGLELQIPKFIGLTEENRRLKDPPIPAFPLSCRGYQKGYSTLLREKFIRIQKEKEEAS